MIRDPGTIGTNIRELSEDEKKILGVKFGLKIIGPTTGILKDTNLCEGFVITTINDRKVHSLNQLEELLMSGQGALIKGIYPDGTHDHYFISGHQTGSNYTMP
jgi:hypothetical protein